LGCITQRRDSLGLLYIPVGLYTTTREGFREDKSPLNEFSDNEKSVESLLLSTPFSYHNMKRRISTILDSDI
jgi:hypothetical protein